MPFPLEGRRAFAVLLAALAVLLLAAGLSRAADPQFTVTNRVPPSFVVVNNLPAATCSICSPCACAASTCPACPAAKAPSSDLPAALVIDGVPHVRGSDGSYWPQTSPAFAAPVQHRFAPSYFAPPTSYGSNCVGFR
jgi:hypothetical protein